MSETTASSNQTKIQRPKNKQGRQKWRLWHQDSKCYWCRQETVLVAPDRKTDCHNLATIDHLRPRYWTNRSEPIQKNEQRHVLACSKCNNGRDSIDYNTQLSLDERRKRSRREARGGLARIGVSGLLRRYTRRLKRAFRPVMSRPGHWQVPRERLFWR